MRLSDLTLRILSLAAALHTWLGQMLELDRKRRERLARYAEAIAATLARAAEAFTRLEQKPDDKAAFREGLRELARIGGYLEDIVGALRWHLDGRKLAGVKRRLEPLVSKAPVRNATGPPDAGQIERLLAAEGYFRALADALRS